MGKIKLVLVDDELTSRNTVKKYLEDNELYEVAAEFQSGKAALEWLRQNSIDILLCDMQMPGMDGVELMRNAHIIDEYLPIIAISGFDDFNYVRGSLVNGASNYLLKHEITKESLINVLEQIRERYRIVPEGKSIYQKRGCCINNKEEFTAEKIRCMSEEGSIDFRCVNVAAIAIAPDFKFYEGINFAEYKNEISKAVIDILGQILGEKYKYLIYVNKKKHIFLLVSFAEEKSTIFMINTLNNLVNRLQKQTVRMLDITTTVVQGEIHTKLEEAMAEEKHLEELLQDKLYLGGNRKVIASISQKIEYSRGKLPEQMWDQLRFELSNHIPGCAVTLNEMFNGMEQKRYSIEAVLQNCGTILQILEELHFIDDVQKHKTWTQMKEYEEFEQFRSHILSLFHEKIQYLMQEEKQSYTMPVAKVIEYIKQNYTKDISLEKCAELVGSSYTYLSREFKKETGMRFVEYLNRQRINKAKSLLIRNDISMKEIVELSGFRNYNYFFKVFKESEGTTPSEFAAKK